MFIKSRLEVNSYCTIGPVAHSPFEGLGDQLQALRRFPLLLRLLLLVATEGVTCPVVLLLPLLLLPMPYLVRVVLDMIKMTY